MFHRSLHDDLSAALSSEMSLISEFFWMTDYEKLRLLFRTGTFCVADFI